MKKSFFAAIAAVAMVAMAACSNNKAAETTDEAPVAEKTAFTGVLPGADCDGIWYTLQLNDGNYDLIETYFNLDTTATAGLDEILSVKSEGVYEKGEVNGKNVLRLISTTDDALYFCACTDSTLTMVNAEYEAPATPEYYTLNLVK